MSEPILLVEDDDSDALFMRLALEGVRISNPLVVARDGREALDYLAGEGPYRNRRQHPLPKLVLLDLRLPHVPGLEVLKWMREQPALAQLTVIVCSGSDQDADVEAAYALGAEGYIVKPGRPSELGRIAGLIKKYFLEGNGLPPDCKEWQAVNVPKPERAPR